MEADTSKKGRRFAALRVKEFRWFFLSQVVSLIGTWMQQTALGWLTYSTTGSSFYLGLVMASLSLPILLLSLVGGVFADRFKKRNIIILTQTLLILPAIFLGFMTQTGLVTLPVLVFTALIIGTINAMDIPSRQSYFVEVVGKECLLNAIVLNSAAFHLARMTGPIAASLIIQSAGMSACFYLNALSFLPVIAALRKMPVKEVACGVSTMMDEIKDGLLYTRDNKALANVFFTVTVFSLFALPFSQFLPVFADKVFHAGVNGFGMLMSALGSGAFTAGVVLAWVGDIKHKKRAMSVTGFLFPILLFSFSITTNLTMALILLPLIGFNAVMFLTTTNAHVQLTTPDNIRGRVMSVYTLLFLGMTPIGSAIIGSLAESLEVHRVIASLSAVSFLGFIVFRRKWG